MARATLLQASKAQACQLNNVPPLQIGLSPAALQSDTFGRSYTRGTVCETTTLPPLTAAELSTPQAQAQQGLKRCLDDAQDESRQAGSKRRRHEDHADGMQAAAAALVAEVTGHAAHTAPLGGVQKAHGSSPEKHALPSSADPLHRAHVTSLAAHACQANGPAHALYHEQRGVVESALHESSQHALKEVAVDQAVQHQQRIPSISRRQHNSSRQEQAAGAPVDSTSVEEPHRSGNTPQQGSQPESSSSSEEESEDERAPESAIHDPFGQMVPERGSQQQKNAQHGAEAQQQAIQAALRVSPGAVQHQSTSIESEELSSSEEEDRPASMPNGAQHAQQLKGNASTADQEAQQPGSAHPGMAQLGRQEEASSSGDKDRAPGATAEDGVPAQQAAVPNGSMHPQGDSSSSSGSEEQSEGSDKAGRSPQPELKPSTATSAAQQLLLPDLAAQSPYLAANKAESSRQGGSSSSSEIESESSEEGPTPLPLLTAAGALPAPQQAHPAPARQQAEQPAEAQSSSSKEQSGSLEREEPQQPLLAPSKAAAEQQRKTAEQDLPDWIAHAVGDGKSDWTSSSDAESELNRASGKAAGAQQPAPAAPKQEGAMQTVAGQGRRTTSSRSSEQEGRERARHPDQAEGSAPHQAHPGKGKQAAAMATQPQAPADRDTGAAAAGPQPIELPAVRTRHQKGKAQEAAHGNTGQKRAAQSGSQPQDRAFPDSAASKKVHRSIRAEAGHANGAAVAQEADARALATIGVHTLAPATTCHILAVSS